MAILTARQIAVVAQNAGFTGRDLVLAIAVCLAESGGKTDADNTGLNKDGSVDRGLWQINSIHSDLLSSGAVFNPSDNARMARSVWQSQGWSGWSTYNNGAYLAFMPVAQMAAANTSGVSVPVVDGAAAASNGPKIINPPAAAFPTRVNGANKTFGDASYDIKVNGRWVKEIERASTLNNVAAQESLINSLTLANWRTLATWLTDHSDSAAAHDFLKHPTKTYLRRKTGDNHNTVQQMVLMYIGTVDKSFTTDPTPLPNLDPTTIIKQLVDFFNFLTNAHNWLRIAMFVVGGGLVLMALYKFANITPPAALTKGIPL